MKTCHLKNRRVFISIKCSGGLVEMKLEEDAAPGDKVYVKKNGEATINPRKAFSPNPIGVVGEKIPFNAGVYIWP